MKVENQKPWLFEINNLDSNKINPFLSDSSYLTIEFKVENLEDYLTTIDTQELLIEINN